MSIEAMKQALEADGCERIKDFYNVGPVQRAAVESFVAAIAQAEQLLPSYQTPTREQVLAAYTKTKAARNIPDVMSTQGLAFANLLHEYSSNLQEILYEAAKKTAEDRTRVENSGSSPIPSFRLHDHNKFTDNV